MAYQTTLKNSAEFSGVGLHSGAATTVRLRPATAGTGIVFHRVDLSPSVTIEALARNVVNTRLSTTIGKSGATVATIEHLLAALQGMGIDNVHIDINGPEVPILDGSARPFAEGIRKAGVEELPSPRKYIVVTKPVTVSDGDKKISIIPSRYFRVSCDIRFNHACLDNQFRSSKLSNDTFYDEIASARTFGFLAEVEMLKAKDYGQYADPVRKDLVVGYITTDDITGGNSGSPVINANGELIGLAFDGNYEALSHKINFDKDLCRTICLDIRYMLWCVDKLGGASNLIKELKLVR